MMTTTRSRGPSRGVRMGKTRRRFVETSDKPSEKPNKPRLLLAQLRKRRALSATELARLAGVAVSSITRIEDGQTPRYLTIRKIADALGVRPEDIAWPGDPLGLDEE